MKPIHWLKRSGTGILAAALCLGGLGAVHADSEETLIDGSNHPAPAPAPTHPFEKNAPVKAHPAKAHKPAVQKRAPKKKPKKKSAHH